MLSHMGNLKLLISFRECLCFHSLIYFCVFISITNQPGGLRGYILAHGIMLNWLKNTELG